MLLRRERPASLLSPEGSALEGEPQVLAHQVANPVGATVPSVTPRGQEGPGEVSWRVVEDVEL